MANTKDYAMREMVYDECFSSGKEFTGKQLMEIVNRRLEARDMLPIQSRTTFMQDIQEMNSKFHRLYGKDCIVYENRNKKRYYRYADGVESIYNRELTQNEVDNLLQVRNLLQGFNGMPDFDWIGPMMTRLDQNIIGKQKTVASFEGGTKKDKEYLMLLFNAIINRQVLDVEYRKYYRDSETLVLHPYYLKQYWRRWYLFAKREGSTDIEHFALDCIESIKENKSVKYKGTKTSFKHYFDHLVGITTPSEDDIEHVVLWAGRGLMPYLEASPIHKSQKIINYDDWGCTLTLDVKINRELIREILYYAEDMCVLAPTHLREHMIERFGWCIDTYKNVEGEHVNLEGFEPRIFTFNYIHIDRDDWKDIQYRLCLGNIFMDGIISDYTNNWNYFRVDLERIIDHSETLIELYCDDDPTKILLKKEGDMLDIKVTPNRFASKERKPFNGWARCKDVVRELYNGLVEAAKAFPQEYVDGCPYTREVVLNAIRSKNIENYLKEE